MNIKLEGTLSVINETETVGSYKKIQKRTCVLVTGEQYKQDLLIEFVKDVTSKLNGYSVGDKVTIEANLNGRKWTNSDNVDKYFLSLQGWRISLNQDKSNMSGIINDNSE